jgi:hypothetical protein
MTLPMVTPPYEPESPADANIVAVGADQQIFLSPDFGTSWPATQRIPLAGNPSPSRLFVATTTRAVFRSDRSGSTWSVDTAPGGPLGMTGSITDIAVDWGDATRSSVYVPFGGQSSDRRRVWRFDGTKWQPRKVPTPARTRSTWNIMQFSRTRRRPTMYIPERTLEYGTPPIGV